MGIAPLAVEGLGQGRYRTDIEEFAVRLNGKAEKLTGPKLNDGNAPGGWSSLRGDAEIPGKINRHERTILPRDDPQHCRLCTGKKRGIPRRQNLRHLREAEAELQRFALRRDRVRFQDDGE